MSSAQKITKKQKKALAFRERKGKGKGKAQGTDDAEDNDVPVIEDQDALEAEAEAGPVEDAPQPAKHTRAARATDASAVGDGQPKQAKKRKREEDDEAAVGDGQSKQKQKKKKRKAGGEDGAAVTEGDDAEAEGSVGEGKGKGKQRFILFVGEFIVECWMHMLHGHFTCVAGNLKYATPKELIEKHFAACGTCYTCALKQLLTIAAEPPPTIRLLTPKASSNGRQPHKSKGCAFLEFTAKSALQQALKLHQSELDGRMINVELTAGGGGKSDVRIEKLKKRNKELHEQRVRRPSSMSVCPSHASVC